MDAARWRRVEAVLDRALDAGPAAWAAVVADGCADDPELRRDVEALLAEYGRHEDVLATGAGAAAAAMLDDAEEARAADRLLGERLGPWRIVRQVGHGGMSRVFLGERADGEYAQRVAVKVLRAGLDTPADRERFRAERRILAALDHPNIARMLDGGVTPDGRPYLVLEFVEGEPLTAYAEARRLGIAARLRLFLQVAEATEAAHHRLVVHRDLKPSNILVGADGRPRLLDFGIAKIVDPEAGAEATASPRRWLTPGYAAPEQFAGGPVTTATDVYQLGAVLYELLSGRHPFDAPTADPATLEARVLRQDPSAPSSHAPALRGDLDAVVLKALRKEPAARYASVAELADDVRRVLAGEPVAARAGDRAYRWRRWVRRRAVPLALGAAALAAAAGYAATLAVQNRRIAGALAEATAEREKAEQVTGFLLGLFQANDPRQGAGDTVSARTLLARGEARAEALDRQPAVQAEMFEVIGRARSELGPFAAARANLERALAIRRRALGDSHPNVARSHAALARLDARMQRYADAERGYRAALERLRPRLGDTAGATQDALFGLANAVHAAGRAGDARPLFETWERRAALRSRPRDALYANQLHEYGELVAIGARRDTAALDRAARLFREAMEVRRALYGPRHVDVAASTSELAHALWKRGREAEAEPYFRSALSILRAAHPAGRGELVTALGDYGARLTASGRPAEAVPLLREAAAVADRDPGADPVLVAGYEALLGDALRATGAYAAAEPVLRGAEARLRETGWGRGPTAVRTRLALGDVLHALGRVREAEALLLPAYTQLAAERGTANPQTQLALRELVKLYETTGRAADAARYRALLAPAGPNAGSR
jgi:serine/threonine-protein kinase